MTYAWAPYRADVLREKVLPLTSRSAGAIAVQVEEVWAAFCLGLARFLDDLDADPARAGRVYARADKFFSTMPGQPGRRASGLPWLWRSQSLRVRPPGMGATPGS